MRFLLVFLTALALMGGVYLAAMVVINPYGDFASTSFPVVLLGDRYAKMHLFESFKAAGPVDGVILGSSRTMKLDPAAFQKAYGGRFFNFGVTNAKAEDFLAIKRWLSKTGASPRYFIVAVDIDAVLGTNQPDEADDWLAGNDDLKQALLADPSPIQALLNPIEKYKKTFSVPFARDAVRSIELKRHPQTPRYRFERNGYLRFLYHETRQAAGIFNLDSEISDCCTMYEAKVKRLVGFSAQRKAYLEEFLRTARANGVVKLWITPVHPRTKQALETATDYTRLLAMVRTYLQDVGARMDIPVYDLSEESHFNGSDTGWYDCYHVDAANAALITERLTEGVRARGL